MGELRRAVQKVAAERLPAFARSVPPAVRGAYRRLDRASLERARGFVLPHRTTSAPSAAPAKVQSTVWPFLSLISIGLWSILRGRTREDVEI